MAEMIPWAYVEMMLEGASCQGFDPELLLQAARVSASLQGKPFEVTDYVRLMRVVTTTMDDEMMGLLHRPQRLGYFALACSHASQAQSLLEAQLRLVSALSLIDNSLQFQQNRHGGVVRLQVLRQGDLVVRNERVLELTLMLLHRFLSWLSGDELLLQSVTFDGATPEHRAVHTQWFSVASISYNASSSGLNYSLASLQQPVVRSEAEAAAWARRTPLDALLPSRVISGVGQQVASWLAVQLRQNGELPSMQKAAAAHGLSTHTLRRRLHAHGSDYLQLRNQVRRDQAIKLLNTTEHSVECIANKLGFSEASAFVRAFRAWTGLTPRRYRFGVLSQSQSKNSPDPHREHNERTT